MQPAIDTPEVRALTTSADAWVDDHALMTDDATLTALLEECGATLIGYRALKDAMRVG